ncbi:MAG: GPO family capsid scaffolding protein [Sphingomonadaceae bacterium]|nr:GPO family capsid scaffolding protein [Sphingomonadaceae bacterium]
MKTKPFLLATAGSTVDGRNIDDKMIEEMASSYDPKTYGARLNIEHIRGISPDKPFNAKGDILELTVGEVDVNFNGKTEKRKALYGVFDVTDDAVAINKSGQKVYPSIEIEPNFAGKGFAYLMGCALTDSPAAIATERLQFNRQLPGTLKVDGDTALPLEFAEDPSVSDENKGLLKGIGALLDGFAAKFGAPKDEAKPEPKADDKAQTFTVADLKELFTGMGDQFNQALQAQSQKQADDLAALTQKFTALETKIEGTPSQQHNSRPQANGASVDRSKVF